MREERPPGRTRFEALYAAEGRRVLAYALRRTDQPADAADVLAEVFLVAWRRLDAVPPGDDARLWLYGVARRVLANQRRSIRRRDRLGQRLAGVLSEHVVADPAEAAGSSGVVREALRRLSDADREVIQLTIWEGLDATQVAEVLGVPAATVRTRLHRARRRLRSSLAEMEGDGEHHGLSGHAPVDERPLVRDHEDHR
jgi:RNA polymerase sigma factor (sigma-70 family)